MFLGYTKQGRKEETEKVLVEGFGTVCKGVLVEEVTASK